LCAPAVLGRVHRRIGRFQQVRQRVGILGKDRHAKRGRHAQMLAGKRKILGDARQDLGGHQFRLAVVPDVAQHDGELIAAHPRNDVARPYRATNAVGDRAQHVVAYRVAQCLVQMLEMVQIEQQQCHATTPQACLEEQRLAPLVQFRAIGQPCQRVMLGHVSDVGVGQRRLLPCLPALVPETAREPGRQQYGSHGHKQREPDER